MMKILLKKLLFMVALICLATISNAQSVTIDSAPTSVGQAEMFTMTATYDTGVDDSVKTTVNFIVRLYNTADESFSWVAAKNVDQAGMSSGTIDSGNITIPGSTTPTSELEAGYEYRLVVTFQRNVGGNVFTQQVVTITEALVPTLTHTSLPAQIDTSGNGDEVFELSWENVTPGATSYNQLRDANGDQVGGFSFEITTTSGSQVLNWNFFGSGTLVAGTNAKVFSQYSGAEGVSNESIPVVATLSIEDFNETSSLTVYPNPTTQFVTIESKTNFESVKVYNVVGKEVKAFENTNKLDVENLSTGIYMLKTNTGLKAKFIKR